MPNCDLNLLFGVLALQLNFITREALVSAMDKWILARDRPLGELLQASGELDAERRQLLDALVQEHLRQHAGDARQSLAAMSSIEPAQDVLKEVADPELQASVALLPNANQVRVDTETVIEKIEQTQKLADGSIVRYFGEYEILEELGTGGMGVVYKARQKKLGRIIALKMIRAGELANPQEVKRFQAEAKAAAGLSHPGIVSVHEVSVHNGQHFYTMDYVEGGSLSRLHRDAPVPTKQSAEMVRQLADAVHYSHGQGIVHRDLKPANVLLTSNGIPRITDFGLAKRMWSHDDLAELSMTETGQILGTAGYMSPEQASGKTRLVGPPADIYALGAVLYALLTSRAPFVGESQADTIQQVIHREPVSPRALNPGLARDLETICLKCLEKEPHKRYGTAQLLAEDLARFLDGQPVLARPVGPASRTWRWCRRNRALSALGLVVLLVAVVSPLVATQMFRLASDREKARIDVTDKAKKLNTSLVLQQQATEMASNSLAAELKAKSELATALEAEKRASEFARESTRIERRRRYVSDMSLIVTHWDSGNLAAIRTLLSQYEPRPGEEDLREFAWRYWSHSLHTHDRLKRIPTPIRFPYSTVLSPDGRRMAFANSSSRVGATPFSPIHVRGYDAPIDAPDEFRLPLSDPRSGEAALAFVVDGNTLAVRQRDEVTLWDLTGPVAKKETLPMNITPENGLGDASFSDNGRFLVVSRVSHSAEKPNQGHPFREVWDLMERKRVGPEPPVSRPRTYSLSNDHRNLTDSNGGVWSLTDAKVDVTQPEHLMLPRGSLFPNFQRPQTPDFQESTALWDRQILWERFVSEGSSTSSFIQSITHVAVSVPRQEVCWSTSQGVFVKSLNSKSKSRRLQQRMPLGLIYAPDGKTLLAIDVDSITFWPLDSEDLFDPASLVKGNAATSATSPLGTYFVTGQQMWDTATGRPLGEYKMQGDQRQMAVGVAVTEKGEVVTCNRSDTVTIWDGLTGKLIESLRTPAAAGDLFRTNSKTLLSVAASPDGNMIAAVGADERVIIWNRKQRSFHQLDGKVNIFLPKVPTLGAAMSPEFSPDGQLLQILDYGLRFTHWNLATLQVVPDRKRWRNCFRFRDQWVLPERLNDGETQLLDFTTGRPVHRLGFPADFSSIVATADGKNIATLSTKGQLTIWDAKLSAPLFTVEDQVGKLCFVDGGGVLALVQRDGHIRRWHGPFTTPK